MTILATTSIDVTKVKTRWTEPYASESIGRALSVLPSGIYHGFKITPDGGTVVRLVQDDVLSESLVVIADTSQRLSFNYQEPVEVTFDLAAYNGQRVYIFVHVDYSVGVNTAAEYRIVDAAELVNPWVNSAALLGTVRVPAAGAVTAGDIDQGSAEIAGLNAGQYSRWQSVNSNPVWSKALAGWEIKSGDPASYFQWNAPSIRLGDISGAQPSPDSITVQKDLPADLIETGDYIYVRVRASASTVANGAFLQLKLGTTYDQTILDANLGSAEDFGFMVQYDGVTTLATLEVTADLTNAANSTGYFDIEQVDIFVMKFGGNRMAVVEPDVSASSLSIGDVDIVNGGYGVMSFDQTGGNEATFRFDAYENGVQSSVALAAPDDRSVISGVPSLVSASNIGIRATEVQDEVFPYAWFSGGAITVNSDPSATIDVTQASVRGTSASLATAAGAASRIVTIAADTVTVPVSGGGGTDNFFIAADPATGTFVSFLEADLSANLDKVLLAWGQYDNAGSAFLGRISVTDLASDITNSIPLTVGNSESGARYSDLVGVLRLIDAGSFPGRTEIVLLGTSSISVDTGNSARRNIPVPSGTRIRGDRNATLVVAQLDTTLFACEGDNVIFEDFNIIGSLTAAGAVLFGDAGSFTGTVMLRNVNVTGTVLFEKCISFTSSDTALGKPGRVIMENCYMRASSEVVEIVSGGTILEARGCTFNGDESAHGTALDLNLSNTSNKFISCRFLAQSQSLQIDGAALFDGCEFETRVIINDDNVSMSNCVFNLSQLVGSNLDALAILGDNFNGSNLRIENDTPTGASSAVGISVDGNDVNLTNVQIDITEGSALRVNSTAQRTNASNFRIRSTGSDASRRGLNVSGDFGNYSGFLINGYPDDASAEFDGSSSRNNLGFYVIDEPTPGNVNNTGSFNNILVSAGHVV